ncbi:helix-turn-helix domain-containing protein [Clostridium sporogenes]|uniref:helix-turn-helix domain-containing protein n=1 Tax=Clostridium sporogenes TaxID=1509 RepID=UPI0009BC1ACF|nr:helix-turn-helix domain-containing protein [Clostridium sporogenes]
MTILITPNECMKILGIGRNRLYEDLLRREDFPSFKIGNKYFINRELLQDWANNQCKN